ncbi:MAG: hypothetical protein IPK08_23845 [Bacteroidetes bacterium]|nr:hypothetical protein [Bacteroidota bacterium]
MVRFCILKDSWAIDTTLNTVGGNGTQYDFNRQQTFQGYINIPIDALRFLETEFKIVNPEAGRITTLSLLAGLDVVLGLIASQIPRLVSAHVLLLHP